MLKIFDYNGNLIILFSTHDKNEINEKYNLNEKKQRKQKIPKQQQINPYLKVIRGKILIEI